MIVFILITGVLSMESLETAPLNSHCIAKILWYKVSDCKRLEDRDI